MRRLTILVSLSILLCSSNTIAGSGLDVRRIQANGGNGEWIRYLLSSFDWATTQSQSGRATLRIISRDAVFLLAREVLKLDADETARVWIEEFDIRDINHDGSLEIVATLNEQCSACPRRLLIFRNSNNEIELFTVDTDYARVADVRDLDGDGVFEVVGRSEIALDGFRAEAAYWPVVLGWNGQTYVDAGERFPSFYENYRREQSAKIAEINSQLERLESTAVSSPAANTEAVLLRRALENRRAAVKRAEEMLTRTGPKSPR